MKSNCSICSQLPDVMLVGGQVMCVCETNVQPKPTETPTHTGVQVNMSMIVGSVEKNEETGEIKVNRFVSFTTGNGHNILYPWEALKNTVLQWALIEEQGEKNVE